MGARHGVLFGWMAGCGLLLGGLGTAAHVAQAGPDPGDLGQVEQLQNTLAAVAEQVRGSVVAIRSIRSFNSGSGGDGDEASTGEGTTRTRRPPAIGTGIILSSDGAILTNDHVIESSWPEDVTVMLATGEVFNAVDLDRDPRRDLAVIRIQAQGLAPARLGSAESVRQGHFAIVLGNPFGSAADSNGEPAMSFGVISAMKRALTQQLDPMNTERYYGNLIQTDARIHPGNSGGPLLNIKGEVVGINTAISSREGKNEIGYAIPLDARTRAIIDGLLAGRESEYGFLGVALTSADLREASPTGGWIGGARVESVELGTPAAAAELRVGDVITRFAGQQVFDADQLIDLVGAAPVGEPLVIEIRREAKRMEVKFELARRKMPPPTTFTWRGMKLAHPDWEVARSFKLPVRQRGAVVIDVAEGGPAAKAGLRPGQVIQKFAGRPIQGILKLSLLTRNLIGPTEIEIAGNPPITVTLPSN